MEPLSKKQAEVLEWMIQHVERWGTQPGVRDICRFLGGVAPNAGHGYLRALEKKGWVRLSKGRMNRSVEFVGVRFQRVASTSNTEAPQ